MSPPNSTHDPTIGCYKSWASGGFPTIVHINSTIDPLKERDTQTTWTCDCGDRILSWLTWQVTEYIKLPKVCRSREGHGLTFIDHVSTAYNKGEVRPAQWPCNCGKWFLSAERESYTETIRTVTPHQQIVTPYTYVPSKQYDGAYVTEELNSEVPR